MDEEIIVKNMDGNSSDEDSFSELDENEDSTGSGQKDPEDDDYLSPRNAGARGNLLESEDSLSDFQNNDVISKKLARQDSETSRTTDDTLELSESEFLDSKDPGTDSEDENVSVEEEIEDSEDEEDTMDTEQLLERERKRLKEAKETISTLISNIGEYKKVLEHEKQDLQLQQDRIKDSFKKQQDSLQKKVDDLQRENEELSEVIKDLDEKIQMLEDDKQRKNKETMENLQTLLKEMTYIEEVNEQLKSQLEIEKQHHQESNFKLETTTQIIEQLELKIQKQDKQLLQLQQMMESNQRQSSFDPKIVAELKQMADDSLVKEILQLKQQLQQEKQKIENIDTLLSQARKISGIQRDAAKKDDAEQKDLLNEEKEKHNKTKKLLEDEKAKADSERTMITKLEKRIKDLIQSHSNTLAQLEEERSKSHRSTDSSPDLKARIEYLEKQLKEARSGNADANEGYTSPRLRERKVRSELSKSKLESPPTPVDSPVSTKNKDNKDKESRDKDKEKRKTVKDKDKEKERERDKDKEKDSKDKQKEKDDKRDTKINVTEVKKDQPAAEEGVRSWKLKTKERYTLQEFEGKYTKPKEKESQPPAAVPIGSPTAKRLSMSLSFSSLLSSDKNAPQNAQTPISNPIPVNSTLQSSASVPPATSPRQRQSTWTKGPGNTSVVVMPTINTPAPAPAAAPPAKMQTWTASALQREMQIAKAAMASEAPGVLGREPSGSLPPPPTNGSGSSTPSSPRNLSASSYPSNGSPSSSLKKREKTSRPHTVSFNLPTNAQAPSRSRSASVANRPESDTFSLLPEGWEDHIDPSGEMFYIDHYRHRVSRVHPVLGKNTKAQRENLVKIFAKIGTATIDLKQFSKSAKNIARLTTAQRCVRGWLERKNYKELVKLNNFRHQLAKALCETEKAYVKSLEIIVKNYLIPCREKKLLKSKTITLIFSAIDSILDMSKIMLEMFEVRLANWNSHTKIGDIFLKHLVPSLSLYQKYYENYQNSIKAIKSSNFATILTKLHKKQDLKTGLSFALDLPTLLAFPIAQIAKYKQYLEGSLRVMFRDEEDYEYMQQALLAIIDLNSAINTSIKQQRDDDELTRIQKTFTGAVPELRTPGRAFVREGTLIKLCRKIPKKRWFVLFSDALMYGAREKEERDAKVKFHRLITLSSNSRVKDLPDKTGNTPNGFQIVTTLKSFVVFAESPELKKSWTDALDNVFTELQNFAQKAQQSDVDLAPVWEHDKEAKNCRLCNSLFTVINRRHHCRRCGKLVCGSCSNNKTKLPSQGMCRVCDQCFEELGGKIPLKQKRKSTLKIPLGSFISFWALPENVICHIFAYLDMASLKSVMLTCKTWQRITDKDQVWRPMFLKRWKVPDCIVGKSWKERYHVEVNWDTQQYTTNTLKGHTASITCLQFDGDKLVSGSVDTKINLWDLTSNHIIRTFRGHTNTVRALYLDVANNIIISGSEDKTVKIWELQSGRVLQTLKDHSAEVNCLAVDRSRNLLFTGSGDKTVKAWDMSSWKSVQTFKGHSNKIFALQVQDNTLVTGSQDKTVRLWDTTSAKCLNVIEGHTDSVRCVQLDQDKNKIISGSDDSTIKIYDLAEGEQSLVAHPGHKVTCLQFDNNKLLTGSNDGSIKVWDSLTNEVLYVLDPKAGWVRCLQFSQELLVTGHGDNSLRVWNFNPVEETV